MRFGHGLAAQQYIAPVKVEERRAVGCEYQSSPRLVGRVARFWWQPGLHCLRTDHL